MSAAPDLVARLAESEQRERDAINHGADLRARLAAVEAERDDLMALAVEDTRRRGEEIARAEAAEQKVAALAEVIEQVRAKYASKAVNPSARFVRAQDVVDDLAAAPTPPAEAETSPATKENDMNLSTITAPRSSLTPAEHREMRSIFPGRLGDEVQSFVHSVLGRRPALATDAVRRDDDTPD